MDIDMDYIRFVLPRELKKEFQIKTIRENTDMTEKLIELIKKYLDI